MLKFNPVILAFFFIALSVVHAVPLKKKKSGVAVAHTAEQNIQAANGHTSKVEKVSEKVKNLETGQEKAVEKLKSQKDDEKPKEKVKVTNDISTPHIKNELPSSELAASYVFETSDLDGVKAYVEDLVQKKKVSKETEKEYMKEVEDILEKMTEEAFEEMLQKQEKTQKEDDRLLAKMLLITNQLNEDQKLTDDLTDLGVELFRKFKKEGDGYAKELLKRFGLITEEAIQAGYLHKKVQENIIEQLMDALKTVDSALNAMETEEREEKDLENLKN